MTHFGNKSVIDHLKEARLRGAVAASEIHGTEQPGHLAAACDAAKETAFILAALILLFNAPLTPLLVLSFALLIWKVGRSALLGWARLERLHRLIEQERWEIEHRRDEEEEELTALYQAKGLSGQTLKDVVTTLASDDNRLLQVMLEEEMGLTLEAYEHPLKQCVGAGVGVLVSAAAICLSLPFGGWGILTTSALLVLLASFIMAKTQGNSKLEAGVWSFALLTFSLGLIYLLIPS